MGSGRHTGFVTGKIPPETLLRTVYTNLGKKDKRVLVGPGIGRDSAAVKQDGTILVFTTDPITGTPTTTGARPKWYMCTILLPVGTREDSLREITREIHETAKRLGIAVVGSHTEATPGLDRPIISGFMVGETRGRVLSAEDGRPGDSILLTKTVGLEGTAILARDKAALLKKKGVPEGLLKLARSYQEQISVVEEALLTAKLKGVHALHDPTEGGVLNGLWEMAEASGLGIEVWAEKIPVAPATNVICLTLGLDPLKLMSSGTLLLAVEPSSRKAVQKALQKTHVRLTEVGRLTSRNKGRVLVKHERRQSLRAVSQDELYKLA
ncbi:hydrogenase [Candidatus Bathyarchaeota archaeon]|nr:MAG: hydrogenase [Candidatus Bathyarchaeota archaeon]